MATVRKDYTYDEGGIVKDVPVVMYATKNSIGKDIVTIFVNDGKQTQPATINERFITEKGEERIRRSNSFSEKQRLVINEAEGLKILNTPNGKIIKGTADLQIITGKGLTLPAPDKIKFLPDVVVPEADILAEIESKSAGNRITALIANKPEVYANLTEAEVKVLEETVADAKYIDYVTTHFKNGSNFREGVDNTYSTKLLEQADKKISEMKIPTNAYLKAIIENGTKAFNEVKVNYDAYLKGAEMNTKTEHFVQADKLHFVPYAYLRSTGKLPVIEKENEVETKDAPVLEEAVNEIEEPVVEFDDTELPF